MSGTGIKSVWPVVLLAGCGGAVSTSTSPAADSGTPLDAYSAEASTSDAEQDRNALDEAGDAADGALAPALGCEGGGYFVTVNTDGATQVLTDGCEDAGLAAPGVTSFICAEDCQCPTVHACSPGGGIALTAQGACGGIQQIGAGSVRVSLQEGDGAVATGTATMHVLTIGPAGGVMTGDFEGQLLADDGGAGGKISGTFCVQSP
jgi:hypothetical protein